MASPDAVWSDGQVGTVTRHHGWWTLEDRFRSPWHYLPVEVPPGALAVRAELYYDRSAGVLDLGCLGAAGFRGWSGGARDSFTIMAGAATPGYLPGEPEPGTWQVIIGIYRLPLEGVEYRLTVEVGTSPGAFALPPAEPPAPPLPRPPRRELPAAPGRRWLAGDLHSHTVHSDGALTVAELARLAASQGLDFLAVTDHNTVSHYAELPAAAARYGLILLPGQEVTIAGGHAGAIGAASWIDFRDSADSWLAATEQAGGLLSVNHPLGGESSWTLPMQRRPPLAEIWHWTWLDPHWTTQLAWWTAWDPGAIPVGGSDWHRPGPDAPPGNPTTWVECEDDSAEAILAGLRAGRTAVSAGRDGPVLLRAGGEVVAVDAEGTVLAGPEGPRARVRGPLAAFPAGPTWYRLLDGTGATVALCG